MYHQPIIWLFMISMQILCILLATRKICSASLCVHVCILFQIFYFFLYKFFLYRKFDHGCASGQMWAVRPSSGTINPLMLQSIFFKACSSLDFSFVNVETPKLTEAFIKEKLRLMLLMYLLATAQNLLSELWIHMRTGLSGYKVTRQRKVLILRNTLDR